MRATWLGQGGWYLECGDRTLMLDPYLSHSVQEMTPSCVRRMPIAPSYLHAKIDYLLLTHAHLDHTDPKTLEVLLDTPRPITVLAPRLAWEKVRRIGGAHRYVLLERASAWGEAGLGITAVHAAHSDPSAVGYIMETAGKQYYFAGDTLYHEAVIADVRATAPLGVEMAFVPINGVGNNMNADEAATLCHQIGARCAVPVHFGMFDGLDGTTLSYPTVWIPKIYEAKEL